MDKVAQARIRRAETALLNLGIKSRDELAIYDLRAGVEGLSGIGPTLRKVIDKARRMTDSEFVATFPLIPLHAPEPPGKAFEGVEGYAVGTGEGILVGGFLPETGDEHSLDVPTSEEA